MAQLCEKIRREDKRQQGRMESAARDGENIFLPVGRDLTPGGI